jgi:hypothetical protein
MATEGAPDLISIKNVTGVTLSGVSLLNSPRVMILLNGMFTFHTFVDISHHCCYDRCYKCIY